MERTEALATIKEVAAEVLSVDPDLVTETARFKEDLDADSLDLVELVMGLEERFDIEVPEDDLEGVTTSARRSTSCSPRSARRAWPANLERTALDHRGRVRVAVTGLGVKTPAGHRPRHVLVDARSRALDRGADHALRPVATSRCASAARSATSTRPRTSAPKEARRVDRVTQLGFAAAADALADAGEHRCDPARSAVIVGTGVGGLITLEEQVGIYIEKGAARVSPFLVPMMMANATAGTDRDAVRLDRPELLRRHRVRGERERDR